MKAEKWAIQWVGRSDNWMDIISAARLVVFLVEKLDECLEYPKAVRMDSVMVAEKVGRTVIY